MFYASWLDARRRRKKKKSQLDGPEVETSEAIRFACFRALTAVGRCNPVLR